MDCMEIWPIQGAVWSPQKQRRMSYRQPQSCMTRVHWETQRIVWDFHQCEEKLLV